MVTATGNTVASSRSDTSASPASLQQNAPSAQHASPRYNYWLAFFTFSLIMVNSSIAAVSHSLRHRKIPFIICWSRRFRVGTFVHSITQTTHMCIPCLKQRLTESRSPIEAWRIKNGPSAAP